MNHFVVHKYSIILFSILPLGKGRGRLSHDLPKKQAELVEKAFGRALKYMKELADMTISANADSLKIMQDRARDSISEMRELAEKISSPRR